MNNDRPLTTVELAGPEHGEERDPERTQPVAGHDPAESRAAAAVEEPEAHPFFAAELGDGFREVWRDIQVAFVDDPKASVHKADTLVTQVMQSLAEAFANERAGLEQQWSNGTDVSTEELRVAFQRYRAFFDRLLSM